MAQDRETATTSRMKPISSASLIGVRKRTIDSAPSRPRESGSENWMAMKMAVIDGPMSVNDRWILATRRAAAVEPDVQERHQKRAEQGSDQAPPSTASRVCSRC